MFDPFREAIQNRFETAVLSRFGAPAPALIWTYPPRVALGDLACPVAFELARRTKRAPAEIAADLLPAARGLPGVARAAVAAGGYLNLFLDRPRYVMEIIRQARSGAAPPPPARPEKKIIEHTNINPNKAAHVGHLRNAVLGDTLGRALRYLGEPVEIQNYIDDTGVQVADVIVGLRYLRGIGPDGLDSLPGRIDYYLWDLYRDVTERYEREPDLLERRREVLRDLEARAGENARLAADLTRRVVRRHLETMQRINVTYDLLPWEGDILAERFWEKTFRRLIATGAAFRPETGRNAGCWVMRIPDAAEDGGAEDGEKVLVRSDGTVTYIGKDIAYQLWKFGLLEADFSYGPFHEYPDGRVLWSTGPPDGGAAAPRFGRGRVIYNVIDSRQSRLQRLVAEGLRALGHGAEADRSVHFSYEMVTLSRACAAELGILEAGADPDRESVEISGRKGQGVKADDLIDLLTRKARAEVEKRNPEFQPEEARRAAEVIAVGALRYFMIRFNRNRVLTFDLQDALSFEGDTGPYLQYSVVRARNILRKLEERGGGTPADLADRVASIDWSFLGGPEEGDACWEIVLPLTQWRDRVAQAVASLELSTLSRACFQLAQRFNAYYHRFPVIQEEDRSRREARAVLVYLYREQMGEALATLGIEVPDRM
ncbi:MAG: arginine--tRNA ligase [Acidobacteria bacterium]|nr:arginine--tRNA ligase [Acidobacteriota bacterium]